MRGMAGLLGEPVRAPGVDLLQVAGREHREQVPVPFGVKRLHRGDARRVVAAGLDDAHLARRALLLAEMPALGDELGGDLRRRAFQRGYRGVVRQAARPDEQHPAAKFRGGLPHRVPQQPRPPRRAERHRDTVDKYRYHRHRVDAAQQDLQRLRETVVDVHPLGQGHVDLGVEDGPDQS
jgi:hypothetical protein